ncbi:hypothetical protein PR048_012710 [Dryococelus australis]|uniref:Uncharacterized protein n=1 Tax=Dryococelus australis TaxID=614101 RepID=A0ABQ9HQ48_9NEOP|nr:hypothetical protein PR048_012710 [Dryococelus australis]
MKKKIDIQELRPMPLHIIEAPFSQREKLISLSSIAGIKVTMEPYFKDKKPLQCKKCQGFGHNSSCCRQEDKFVSMQETITAKCTQGTLMPTSQSSVRTVENLIQKEIGIAETQFQEQIKYNTKRIVGNNTLKHLQDTKEERSRKSKHLPDTTKERSRKKQPISETETDEGLDVEKVAEEETNSQNQADNRKNLESRPAKTRQRDYKFQKFMEDESIDLAYIK